MSRGPGFLESFLRTQHGNLGNSRRGLLGFAGRATRTPGDLRRGSSGWVPFTPRFAISVFEIYVMCLHKIFYFSIGGLLVLSLVLSVVYLGFRSNRTPSEIGCGVLAPNQGTSTPVRTSPFLGIFVLQACLKPNPAPNHQVKCIVFV